nr:unnamed protein product [Spirometra erinaceieuropaei]
MFLRRGDAVCTSRRCELRHLAAWAERVITRRQVDVSVDGVGVRHPRLQQLSPCLFAGSRQYPRVGEVELMLDAGEQSGVVYRIPCQNYPCHYTGQTGRRLSSRILEHKRAVRRGDPLSQVATHTLVERNEFDFANTRILARAGNKTGRELLEAWVSDTNSINRHIDLPACYHALRPRSQVAQLTPSRSTNGVTTPGEHRGPGGANST